MPRNKGYDSVSIDRADNGFTLRAHAFHSFDSDSVNEIHTDVEGALKSARKLLTTPVKKPAKKKDSGALDAVG